MGLHKYAKEFLGDGNRDKSPASPDIWTGALVGNRTSALYAELSKTDLFSLALLIRRRCGGTKCGASAGFELKTYSSLAVTSLLSHRRAKYDYKTI